MLILDKIDDIFTCTQNGTGLSSIIKLLGFAYNFLLIAVPITLIIFSIVQLIKAITSSKEDNIKKAYSKLIKMLIVAFLIFFVGILLKVFVSVIDENLLETTNAKACLELFLGQ